MQFIHLYILRPDGTLMPNNSHNPNDIASRIVVTNKTRNSRFGVDMQANDPHLFTYAYFGNGENLTNDSIEFYIAKGRNDMSVDPNFKIETVKVKNLENAKDKFGNDILKNGFPVKLYKVKMKSKTVNIKVIDKLGKYVPFAIIKNITDGGKIYFNFKTSNSSGALLYGNTSENYINRNAPSGTINVNLSPNDEIEIYAIAPRHKNHIVNSDLLRINHDYKTKRDVAYKIINHGIAVLEKISQPTNQQTGNTHPVINQSNIITGQPPAHTSNNNQQTGNTVTPGNQYTGHAGNNIHIIPVETKESKSKYIWATVAGFVLKKIFFN